MIKINLKKIKFCQMIEMKINKKNIYILPNDINENK